MDPIVVEVTAGLVSVISTVSAVPPPEFTMSNPRGEMPLVKETGCTQAHPVVPESYRMPTGGPTAIVVLNLDTEDRAPAVPPFAQPVVTFPVSINFVLGAANSEVGALSGGAPPKFCIIPSALTLEDFDKSITYIHGSGDWSGR
jgi:hypothetical protein